MSDLFAALGLAVALEGLLYAVAPGAVRRYLQSLAVLNDTRLRTAGLFAMALGVVVVWLVRG
ncbi:DUF2065 domain-containing protein [Methylobrevis pamukkalensis]|uniref:DUF2065 domain-containing protein n=1 Tax=Methylobrevis pamukkalensis TaxID=1439726 RepID=A0A1E3H4M4_9HYPH|nr:DUF2065 domain-containing protein [Methylobrevis pamukkalensis]ODN70726.1 hypothetical protein A6302_01947 [Methylobrevis pamukkalensis]